MKLKLRYFIRGLGIGIVFTGIVMSLSLQSSRSRIIRENALTKEEIMEKAMGYGMIMNSSDDTTSVGQNDSSQEEQSQEENQNDLDKQKDDDQKVEESQDVDDQQNENGDKDNKGESSETDKVESNSDSSGDKESSKQEVNEKDEATDESSDEDNSVVTIEYIPIEITSGMTATSVGKLLKEKGIIEDTDEFGIYLSEQGYSSKIRTGDYLIPVDATYKKIADIITRKQ